MTLNRTEALTYVSNAVSTALHLPLSVLTSLTADESVCFIRHLRFLTLCLPGFSSLYKHRLRPTTPQVRRDLRGQTSRMDEVGPRRVGDCGEHPAAVPNSGTRCLRSCGNTTNPLLINSMKEQLLFYAESILMYFVRHAYIIISIIFVLH